MLKQTLQHKLLQKLSPQQIQLMKLLQVPTIELEQRIKEELEANPALDEGREEDNEYDDEFDGDEERKEKDDEFDISDYLSDDETPDYKTSVNNKGVDDDDKHVPIGSGTTFQEMLSSQLSMRLLNEKQQVIAENIIGNLDDSGYLRRELKAIVNDMAFSQNVMTTVEELEEVLAVVQELDPPGVGARDLKECLVIQMKRKENPTWSQALAIIILEDYFDEFSKKHYDKIIKKLELEDEQDLKEAVDEIIRLNPKPGNSMKESSKTMQHVVPDFLVSVEDDELKLQLNQRNAPELRVSKQYKEMLQGYSESKSDKQSKEALIFVRQKIDSAKWFIDAIKQRQNTLLITMKAILEHQESYFLTGDETKLKPMILKDIAEMVNMDISTISRVANSKYVQTPYGTFLLKTFFSESLSTDSGEEVSTREVKKILEDAIEAEDKRKPLTDEKLASLLKEKGYNIARRTVAKYREQLNIPVARMRKEL
ncbi:MAG: RNA polymerase factor sigma-54 [Flavobacteriales bacterium]|nr:RNA polymerase factor sigma-54 [Flavobacteriales bacterium]MDG1766554.1 RNA polymerase factor sigma-54 [Flavobacteriales bacterium]